MPLRFSRHARNRMRRHELTDDDIENAIAEPEWHEVEPSGIEVAWIRFRGVYLKVVYSNEEAGQEVITVGPRPRLPENLR